MEVYLSLFNLNSPKATGLVQHTLLEMHACQFVGLLGSSYSKDKIRSQSYLVTSK